MIESNIREDIEQKIDDYIQEELSAKEIDELWAELIEDDYYLDYLKSVAALNKIINEKNKKKTSILNFTSSAKWISAAAAVLLIVGSVVVFNLAVQPSESIQPITSIELDYYRSADGSATEMEEVNRTAITEANQGNIEAALKMLDKQINEASTDAEKADLMITAGSILYNSGRYSEAIDRFESSISLDLNDPIIEERAYWYLGNTYFQLNEIDEAKEAFSKAYDLNGAYSRVAQSYLKALSTI